ncbi:MAG: DUF2878 domain-containing protein [Blastocatellia bacterium]|nr:DUF2878 domain-containing protein [Blastocatellia bacterium]
MKKLLTIVGIQVGWFASTLGAAKGLFWLGPVVVTLLVIIHLAVTKDRKKESIFILLAAIFGTLVDSFKKVSGLVNYQSDFPGFSWLAPCWITALWVIFSAGFNETMAWLRKRYLLAFLFGLIGGPASYFAAARLGAISFSYSNNVTIVSLGIIWGLVMPSLSYLSVYLEKIEKEKSL